MFVLIMMHRKLSGGSIAGELWIIFSPIGSLLPGGTGSHRLSIPGDMPRENPVEQRSGKFLHTRGLATSGGYTKTINKF